MAHQHQQALWGLNAGMPHQEPLRNGSQSKPGLLSRHAIGARTELLWHITVPFPCQAKQGKMVLVLYIVSKQQARSN